MENLSSQQVEQIKHLLSNKERGLRIDLQRDTTQQDEYMQVASEVPDSGDAAFADLSADLGNAAIVRDVNALRAVEKAYQRIADGNYGACVDCSSAIPYARLQVQPTAERCAPCQEIYEKTHVDAGPGSTM
jgi:DnaK suppressor protein